MTITLRGHHLLCIHGFQGMGYSESFVEKMKEVTHLIRDDSTNPLLPIKVIQELDDVCSTCPHHGGTICLADKNSDAHVKGIDQKVIAKLGLIPNQIYTKQELLVKTQKMIEPADLSQICKGCSWLEYGVCQEGIQRLNTKKLPLFS